MVQDVPIYRKSGATLEAMPVVQGPGGAQVQGLQRLGSALAGLSDNIYERVEANAMMDYSIQLSRDVSRIERENMGNPVGMEKAIGAYSKSFFKSVPPGMRKRLAYQLESASRPALNRAHNQYQQNVDDEARFSTFIALDGVQNEMDMAAQGAFDPNPEIAAASTAQLQELMDRQQLLSTQRTSDGSFLFGPEQSANMAIAARDKTHTAVVMGWFKKQPNKLEAAETWLNGGLEYDLPGNDETRAGLNGLDGGRVYAAMVKQESGGNQFDPKTGKPLTSGAGAVGVGQIMPATGPEAARLAGVAWNEKRFQTDKAYNAKLGRAYFDQQVKAFGDQTLAVMAYNAGPGAVTDFMNGTNNTGKNPNNLRLGDPRTGETSMASFVARFPFKETRDYVRKVKENAGITTVNIRETMPATTLKKVDNELMGALQDVMAIQQHKMAIQERADKEAGTQLYASWMERLTTPVAQGQPQGATPTGSNTGTVDSAGAATQATQKTDAGSSLSPVDDYLARRDGQIRELDAQSQIFIKAGMTDEYVALRKALVSGDPVVENGAQIVTMQNMMARGQDVSQIALASLNQGQIGVGTYQNIINRQEQLRGPAGDPSRFLTTQISAAIAGLTPSSDPNLGVLVYNAQTDFLNAVDAWKASPDNQGRVPTLQDLKPLADEAIKKFNPNPAGAIKSLDAPSYIPAALYSSPDTNTVTKMRDMLKEHYASKYNGDIEKIKNDPDLRKDMDWIKSVEALVTPSANSVGD